MKLKIWTRDKFSVVTWDLSPSLFSEGLYSVGGSDTGMNSPCRSSSFWVKCLIIESPSSQIACELCLYKLWECQVHGTMTGQVIKNSHDIAVFQTEQAQGNVLLTFDFVASVTSSDCFILLKIEIMVGTHSCSLSVSSAFPSSSLCSNREMIKYNWLK